MNIKFNVEINCGTTFASYQYALEKSNEIMASIRQLMKIIGVDFSYEVSTK